MSRDRVSHLKIGLAVGQGTGSELSAIFERVITAIAKQRSIHVEICRSLRIYHSYHTLLSVPNGQAGRDRESSLDAAHLEAFYEDLASRGTQVIFRTAVSARALYLVRQRLEAVKVELFSKKKASLLMVRDQAQGFYSGFNDTIAHGELINRTCRFSKAVMKRILDFSLRRARQVWDQSCTIESITLVYKHHLFDGVFDDWAKEWVEDLGLKVEFVQPDTMNRNILAFGLDGNRLIIASNEYADIMQVIFLDWFNQDRQESSYAKNVYLRPDLNGLSEYQTVHGSADDLKGKDVVNPSATIRAAATILEEYADLTGLQVMIDKVISTLVREGAVTPDQGGHIITSTFVSQVLDKFFRMSVTDPTALRSLQSAPSDNAVWDLARSKKTALLVIDYQVDFLSDQSSLQASLSSPIFRLLEYGRSQQFTIIFTRFIGDAKYHHPVGIHSL